MRSPHYTQLGLITPAERSAGGYRLYDVTTADTITTIKQLEAHGISLDAISAALHATDEPSATTTLTSLAGCVSELQQAIADTTAAHALVKLIGTRAHALIDIARALIDSPVV